MNLTIADERCPGYCVILQANFFTDRNFHRLFGRQIALKSRRERNFRTYKSVSENQILGHLTAAFRSQQCKDTDVKNNLEILSAVGVTLAFVVGACIAILMMQTNRLVVSSNTYKGKYC